MKETFSHGPNILNQHVDAFMHYEDLGYGEVCIGFVRKATNEEIKELCKNK